MRPNFNRASARTSPLLTPRLSHQIPIAVAGQGGAALCAYTAGVFEAVLIDPRFKLVEAGGTSGTALNAVIASGANPRDSRHRLRRFWDMTGAAGNMAAFVPGPLRHLAGEQALRNIGYGLDMITFGMKKGDVHVSVNSATEMRVGAGLHPENIRSHVHEGTDVSRHHALASATLESMGGYQIGPKIHWDGVYTGENPSLEPFRLQTAVPMILITVDHERIIRNNDYPHIIYGPIHKQWEDFIAEDLRPTYKVALDRTRPGLGNDQIRRTPNTLLVEHLRELGLRDGRAMLERIAKDRAQGLHDRFDLLNSHKPAPQAA